MNKLAIFDVDYTITKKETLIEFYKFNIKRKKSLLKYLPKAIFSGGMYVLGKYDEKQVKQSFLSFIDGIDEKELMDIVKEYYEDKLKKILYKDAIKKIKELKEQGYYIYLISASPEFYLNELYKIEEIDKIIGTKFSFEDSKFKSKMLGENCKGKEKVNRLYEVLKEENLNVDFNESYMFSDSLSDRPLLDLVGKPYLINYKKDTKMKVLNWR